MEGENVLNDGEGSRGVHNLLIWDAGAEETSSLVMTEEAMQPLEKQLESDAVVF